MCARVCVRVVVVVLTQVAVVVGFKTTVHDTHEQQKRPYTEEHAEFARCVGVRESGGVKLSTKNMPLVRGRSAAALKPSTPISSY